MTLFDTQLSSIRHDFGLKTAIAGVTTARNLWPVSYRNPDFFNEVNKRGHFAAQKRRELYSAELPAAFSSVCKQEAT